VLNFVYCLDKNYNQQVLTSINSLIENCSKNINIYIIHEDPDSLKLQTIKQNNGGEIKKYKIEINDDFPNLKGAHVSKATYYRLYLSKYLPQNLDHIIYLDADIICLNDPIKSMESTIKNMQVEALGLSAVTEMVYKKNSPVENERFIELDMKNNKYFNAGVLVINFQEWQIKNIEEKLFDIMIKYYDKILYWDQDILNKYYDGKYFELEKTNNFTFSIKNKDRYNQQQQSIHETVNFLHYNGKGKPWQVQNLIFDSSHIYQNEFRKLNLGFYHIVFDLKTKVIVTFLQNIFSLRILKLEKPSQYIYLSIKAIFKNIKRILQETA